MDSKPRIPRRKDFRKNNLPQDKLPAFSVSLFSSAARIMKMDTHKKIVTFGEIMLRLTPPDNLRFNQTKLFRASYGGSEANVAVSLANYGLPSEFITCVPDNRIADACLDDLRSYGVRTDVWASTTWRRLPPCVRHRWSTTGPTRRSMP